MEKETILSQLRARQRRSAVIGWFCVLVALGIVYYIEQAQEGTSPLFVVAPILLMVIVTVVDFAILPIPKCLTCGKPLSFALRGRKDEKEAIKYCPYCSTDLEARI